jgi:two-component system CheB/CheR fusion protein
MQEKPPSGVHAALDPAASDPNETPAEAGSRNVEERPRFPIVGIGASAGGLQALEALTKQLHANGMSFVAVQHLAPGHESSLVELLSRCTHLPVIGVQDGMPLEINRIYVAPPNADLALHAGVLRLMTPAADRGPRHNIDELLRSLAADQGNMAIGVILSGAGSDGTLGLKAIKDEGGITFAQEPATAAQPGMPQSALDAGVADFCMSPAEIGDELMRLCKHPYIAGTAPPKLLNDDVRSKLFVLIRNAFGVDFANYKEPTLDRRIQRRMALHKLARFEDYFRYVQSNVVELNVLYSDLLINVTGFFRDKQPFEELKTQVFPKLVEHRSPDQPIRVWVAGCASGEEPYSIAICLLEFLEQRALEYKIQIFATDIDEPSLVRARQAVYPRSIESDVSPERLKRFFTRTDKGYQLSRRIRDMVVFARHNLGKDPPFTRIDLLSCRNVLIYLQASLQRKVLRGCHYALNPDGFLLLGASESVGDGSDLFTLLDRKAKLYVRKNSALASAFDSSFSAKTFSDDPAPRALEERPSISVLQLADRKIIEQYGPAGVVVNESFDILQYRGKTGRFFEPAPGVASINLLKLARPELLSALRAALHRALSENTRVTTDPIRIGGERADEVSAVRLDVTPLPASGTNGRTLLVVFDEQSSTQPAAQSIAEPRPTHARLLDLERELAATKDYLQTTIQELEAANEELHSSNEELQSANEELQSSNEELETSKEELQSTNEELITLNEELQHRMSQLNNNVDDLQNVLNASTSALVLVGLDLRIRRFSAAAEKLLHLVPGDLGRPIAYVRTVVQARDIERTVSETINTISPLKQKVRLSDGSWYMMHLVPYRSADHMIRDAVIEFTREVNLEQADAPYDQLGLNRTILNALPQALAVLDTNMCVTWGNAAFLALFKVAADIFGRPFEDFWSGAREQTAVWSLLEDVALKAARPFERVPAVARPLLFSARRLLTGENQPALTLVIIEHADHNAQR